MDLLCGNQISLPEDSSLPPHIVRKNEFDALFPEHIADTEIHLPTGGRIGQVLVLRIVNGERTFVWEDPVVPIDATLTWE